MLDCAGRVKARKLISPYGPDSENKACGELGRAMQDFWMLLFTVVFFGLAFGYVYACQKLR
jgi:hypothetical protein